MRKWLIALGGKAAEATAQEKGTGEHPDAESAALARAYIALVEAAYAAGVDLDAAVAREMESRGVSHDDLEAEAVRRGQ